MRKNPQPPRLRDLPLWRLLVALADAERALGPTDKTTRTFAQLVQERLAGDSEACSLGRKGGGR